LEIRWLFNKTEIIYNYALPVWKNFFTEIQ